MGLGLYSGETVGLPDVSITVDEGGSITGASIDFGSSTTSSLGIMPRLGFNLSHFRIVFAYNLPFDEGLPKYFLFTIGFEIGGGE